MRLFRGLLAVCIALTAQTVPGDKKELAVLSGKTLGSSGQPLGKATLTLRPMFMPRTAAAAPVAGTGTVAGGRGAAGVRGAIVNAPVMPPPYAATSDAQGNYIFDGVEPGSYALQAERAGYMPSPYGARSAMGPVTPIVLQAGQRMSDVNIRLVPQSVVSGRVLDEDGEPPSRVQVSLLRRTYTNSARPRYMPVSRSDTDDRGEYRITGLGAGKYYLNVTPMQAMSPAVRRAGGNSQPIEANVPTYFPAALSINDAIPIDVAAGQDLGGINVKLRKAPVYSVRGHVGGTLPPATGQPVRLIVTLTDNATQGFTRSGMVQTDGSFTISGVPAGTWRLVMVSSEGRMQMIATQQITVTQGDLEGISLNGTPPSDLRGVVRVEPGRGAPEPNAEASPTVSVMLAPVDLGNTVSPVNAGPDGSFTLPQVGVGKYTLTVINRIPNGFVRSATLGGRDVLAEGLDLSNGISGSLEVVVSPNGGTIKGTAKDSAGQPLGDRPLFLIPEPNGGTRRFDLEKSTRVRPTGEFQVMGIAPGKYRLYVWDNIEPGAQFDPDFLKLHENEGQLVTVEENSSQQISVVR
ncbi:MAG: hypothetical protein JWN34_3383 [Bryobacterales bacterium]|nr:hypothetical protein [Bryobacterales bacterium]